MTRILLTGGRAPQTLALARLFHAAGHVVFVAESLPRHLCQGSRAVQRCFTIPAPNTDLEGFAAALARIVRMEAIELLIPTCEEIFHVAPIAERLPCEVFIPRWERLRRLHSKWEFIEDVRALGLPVPRTQLITADSQAAGAAAAAARGGRAVLKPVYSRFASRVRVLEPGEQPGPLDASPQQPWVAQAFITGRALCTYGVARQGRLLAHAAYAPHYTASAASVYFEPFTDAAVETWVRTLVEAWGLDGQVAFDLIQTPDGTLYPLECNPRSTSGIHLFDAADRLDAAFTGVARACVRPRPQTRSMVGTAMCLYALVPAALEGPRALAAWGQSFMAARDVIFRWDDPAPALHQFGAYGELVRRAVLTNSTPLEASTRDIAWDG